MSVKTFKCFGWGGETGQIQRIKKGFIELGLTESEKPDFIYSNDEGSHREAIDFSSRSLDSRLILNILDIPEFLLPDRYSLRNVERILRHADSVTSISLHVQRQLIKFFNIKSSVIYQPIMGINRLSKSDSPYRCVFVGRKSDPNKNSYIVHELVKLGLNSNAVIDIGPDYSGIGDYAGVVDANQLSHYYSSADFSFSFGEYEGFNLPVAEAMACGCIPLIHNNLTTREEILPRAIFPEYDEYDVRQPETILAFMQKYQLNQDFKESLRQHFVNNLQDKTSPIGVANRILEVANGL